MLDKLAHTQRILVLRYRFIGDTVLLIPFLRNLRHAFPKAVIDVLVAPNSGEVLTHCPYINSLIYFDTTRKHRYESGESARPKSFWSYVQLLKEKNYDTAFVLKRSFSSAVLAFLAGIPNRIGFDTEWRGALLTDKFPYDKEQHESDCFLDSLRAVEIPVEIPVEEFSLEAFLSTDDKQKAELLLTEHLTPAQLSQPKLLIHLTASNEDKCLPKNFWQQLVPWLLEQFPVTLHCVGASMDGPAYNQLFSSLSSDHQARFYNWCGETSLLESQALIAQLSGVIGVDSGTLHMAAAVNVPVIALYNNASSQHLAKWHPLEVTNGSHQVINISSQSNPLKDVQAVCQQQFQHIQ